MNNFNTTLLRVFIESKQQEEIFRALQAEDLMGVIMVYHLSRTADALERIANVLENGQIAMLDGADTVKRLTDISLSLVQIREQIGK